MLLKNRASRPLSQLSQNPEPGIRAQRGSDFKPNTSSFASDQLKRKDNEFKDESDSWMPASKDPIENVLNDFRGASESSTARRVLE